MVASRSALSDIRVIHGCLCNFRRDLAPNFLQYMGEPTDLKTMKTPPWFTRNRLLSHLRIVTAGTLVFAAAAMVFALNPGSITPGTDVKVTIDNNNIEGGAPNPGFDSKNLSQQ